MVDAFSASDRTGAAITGTSSQSLLGAAITLPQAAMGIDAVFTASFTGTYLNNPAIPLAHNIDLDFVVNSTVVHRSRLYTIAANSLTRTVTADYEIILTESDTAIIKGHGTVSAAGNSGRDIADVTTTETATWDQAVDADIDIKATLSLLADLPTHSLTPLWFRMATLETVTIVLNEGGGSGGGGGGLTEITVADLPFEVELVIQWDGTAYGAVPTGVSPFKSLVYRGPVQPNGVNAPAYRGSIDVWDDTSNA